LFSDSDVFISTPMISRSESLLSRLTPLKENRKKTEPENPGY
jgi:hypothetical protein